MSMLEQYVTEVLKREGEPSPFDVIHSPISYGPYYRVYRGLAPRLALGYPVPDDIDILVIGNNTLLESSFRLKPQDRLSQKGINNPGKSAHIAFTKDIAIACLAMLERFPKREDHLYFVPAPSLRKIGFAPIYCPTSQHPLHVRITPNRLDSEGDIPREYRERLVQLLQPTQLPSFAKQAKPANKRKK